MLPNKNPHDKYENITVPFLLTAGTDAKYFSKFAPMMNAVTTEHTIPYQWHGKQRFMLVKKVKTPLERFYVIRTKQCEYTLQFYDMRWNIISPRHNRFNHDLLKTIGNAIWDAGL